MHALGRPTPLAVYRAVLGVAIVVGSLAMWLGIPFFWIWVMSQLIDEYPSIYLLSLAACPLTMILWGWMLSRLNRVYGELTPHDADAPGLQRSAWLGSMSGERRPRRRQPTLLDVSMVISVVIALSVMAVWFFGFAHLWGPFPE
jgi:hypothetical protein